jgi:ATP-dependent Clp protease protease subunit
MPIGVPRVGYRLPGDSSAQWVDLYNRLYRDRVLFLGSDLDDELSNQLVGIMTYLSIEDRERELFLYINSLGGTVTGGVAVFDVMQYITPTVTTICIGQAASMASFILAGGERGQRIALPHTRIMLHQPAGGSSGQSSEIGVETSEVARIRRRIGEMYVEITGQTFDIISRDLDRDHFMSARESAQYGVVDLVINKSAG